MSPNPQRAFSYMYTVRKASRNQKKDRSREEKEARRRDADDIYDFERTYNCARKRIIESKKISERDKNLIWNFTDLLKALRVSKGRIAKYMYHLRAICENLGVDVEKVTRKDVEHFMANWLYEQGFSPETNGDYIMVLKRFVKYAKYGNVDIETPFPEEVRWLRKTIKPNERVEVDYFTAEEVEKLICAAQTLRDKAMIAVQFDAGIRPSELLLLDVGNVLFDEHGARILVRGKTGERPVRLIPSAPLLARYFETHALKNDLEAPLWLTQSTNYKHQRLGWKTWNRILKIAAKAAGIPKLRIQSKMLRHGSVTEGSNYLTDQQLKTKHGWSKDSRMLSRYGHLKAKDLEEKLIAVHTGKEVKPSQPDFTFVICERCKERGSPGQIYCARCGTPLSKAENAKSASEMEEMWKELQGLKELLLQSLLQKPIQTVA